MKRITEQLTRPDRREFIQGSAAVAGGLMLGFRLPARAMAGTDVSGAAVNAFVHVGADDRVTLLIHKAEMGQGVYTALAQLIAEELECDWSQIHVTGAPVAAAYNHPGTSVQFTGGSTSVAASWEPLRIAGAAARTMLVTAAAATWGVPADECRAARGRVLHPASGRAMRYGELAPKAAQLEPPSKPTLKAPGEFRIIGRTLPRLDSRAKTDGTAVFSIDVRRPNQVVAAVAHAPRFGAKLVSFNAEAARERPGVIEVLRVANGVAIVARDSWSALAARDALEVRWDEGSGARLDTEHLRSEFRELAKAPGAIARATGDASAALAVASDPLTAAYELPYLAHAAMEPLNCVVEITDDRCDIWAGTQYQSEDRNAAAKAAGLRADQVHIHTTYMGGGFGRRANPASDYIVEAVEIALQLDRPVQLLWSREDDMQGGWYRPQVCHRVSASLSSDGMPVAWHQVIVSQSVLGGTTFESFGVKDGIDISSVEGAADLPYAVPNLHVELHSPQVPVPVQWWRSVGHSHTAFVVETFIDELAQRAAQDPLDYRRRLLSASPRHLAVLELAAQRSGWDAPALAGQARGIAVHESFGSVVAEVAEVSLVDGRPRVHRVVCAVHCGRAVNPGQVAAQIESGVLYGLSAALYGEITLVDGAVVQRNFDSYRVARLSDAPVIEVHIVPSDDAPTGVGEPGTPPIAPAVANALARLTGVRARRLPLAHVQFDGSKQIG